MEGHLAVVSLFGLEFGLEVVDSLVGVHVFSTESLLFFVFFLMYFAQVFDLFVKDVDFAVEL